MGATFDKLIGKVLLHTHKSEDIKGDWTVDDGEKIIFENSVSSTDTYMTGYTSGASRNQGVDLVNKVGYALLRLLGTQDPAGDDAGQIEFYNGNSGLVGEIVVFENDMTITSWDNLRLAWDQGVRWIDLNGFAATPSTNGTIDLGGTSNYWDDAYIEKITLKEYMDLTTASPTGTAGRLWFDGSVLNFQPATDKRSISLANGVIIADTTIANTVTETTLYTESISANELYKGSKWHIRVSGYYSTANAADTFTFRLKVGSTTVLSINSTAENVTNGFWRAEFFFTVRSTGASGSIQAALEAVFNDNPKNVANTSTTTIDTTTAEDITATVQWDNALTGNTLTITQGSADIFGVKQT